MVDDVTLSGAVTVDLRQLGACLPQKQICPYDSFLSEAHCLSHV